jgi:hypothetical protein
MYLVKLTGTQELGWKDGAAGSRGPYLLVTKQWLEHLPPLSPTVFNDSAPLTIRLEDRTAVIPYVWHNAKFAEEERRKRGITRQHDEHRLYIAGLAANRIALPQPGDAVVLKSTSESALRDSFDAWIVRKRTSLHVALLATRRTLGNYWTLNDSIGSSLGLIPQRLKAGSIPAWDEPPITTVALGEPSRVPTDPSMPAEYGAVPTIGDDLFERLSLAEDDALSSRTSDEAFRFLVLNAYQMRCAFTSKAIRLGDGLINLEAAHIKPRAHRGLNLTCNGIALCRDLHWAFDKGAFTLTEDMRAEVHPDVTDEFLQSIHGKQAFQPKANYNLPRREFSEHHRFRVYGLFKLSGALRREQ